MPLAIEDYAMIGDCETAALVGRDGSIDWICFPRFDSDACFAALLGNREHGHWRLAPAGDVTAVRRRYRQDTLILETELETAEGAVRLIDFMPLRNGAPKVIRLVEGLSGTVAMKMDLVVRFDYGRTVPWMKRLPDNALRAISGPHSLVLRGPVECRGQDLTTVSEFSVRHGDRVPFVLSYQASHLPPPDPADFEGELAKTERAWKEWSSQCTYEGPWREAVIRSLITIKALTYGPTGGIVAAPTTSLPELVGGGRNWDYRFCWLRDATFTILSLLNAGYRQEAEAWADWLLRAIAGLGSQVQPLYGVAGERRMHEHEIDWLPGYLDSRPVRIGNAAYYQLQLDVFGWAMDALHCARGYGLNLAEDGWGMQKEMLRNLEDLWRKPDEGIWEVRSDPQHFVHSKVMCWVAFDRAISAVERFSLEGPVDHWRKIRDTIHAEVCERGYDKTVGAFVQAYGEPHLDASALLIPIVGFLPAKDPRMLSTTAAIERELMRDGYVLRYDTNRSEDGLEGDEGAFLACTFWLADNMILQDRQADARKLFERLVSLCNDVGLLSEQYDSAGGKLVGNFPQAFSHFALIDTAYNFASAEGTVREADKR
jgi:GH15 family glucan-1,4-alpha-glucosidase